MQRHIDKPDTEYAPPRDALAKTHGGARWQSLLNPQDTKMRFSIIKDMADNHSVGVELQPFCLHPELGLLDSASLYQKMAEQRLLAEYGRFLLLQLIDTALSPAMQHTIEPKLSIALPAELLEDKDFLFFCRVEVERYNRRRCQPESASNNQIQLLFNSSVVAQSRSRRLIGMNFLQRAGIALGALQPELDRDSLDCLSQMPVNIIKLATNFADKLSEAELAEASAELLHIALLQRIPLAFNAEDMPEPD